MERVLLKELNMKSRDEAISFLKALWNQEGVNCPICIFRSNGKLIPLETV